jgi:hypothetical protein
MQILRKYTARVFILKGESMKKPLLILALLCVPLARGQSSFQNPLQGPITATSAACAVAGDQSCVWQKLALAASVATVQVSGTFSATLTVEANNGGANFSTLGTITTAGTTSYVVAGFTDFRVRASAYTSGTAFVTINSSPAPSGGVTSGTADPTGNACAANTLYVQTTTGKLYSCDAGVFAIVSGGGSTVSITATSPIVITPSPTTGTGVISAPTVVTSAAAITNNVLAKGSGGAQGLANSAETDNGATFSTTLPLASSGASSATVPALSLTGTMTPLTGNPVPYVYYSPGTVNPTFNGTGSGVVFNGPSGFGGHMFEGFVNGSSSKWFVDTNGTINAGSSGAYVLSGSNGLFTTYGQKGTAGEGVSAIFASVATTGATTTQSGTLRVGGAVAPAGTYRVSTYMVVTTANTLGNLDVSIGWNDGTAARTATNGTNGQPTDISTGATNFAQGSTIVVANGVNDITYAFTVTQTTGTSTFSNFATLERLR